MLKSGAEGDWTSHFFPLQHGEGATRFLSAPLDSGVTVHRKETSTVPTDFLLELDNVQGWIKVPLARGSVAPNKPADPTKSNKAEMWRLFHAQEVTWEEERMEYQCALNQMHRDMEVMCMTVGQTHAELLRVQDEARLGQMQQVPPGQPPIPADGVQGGGGVPAGLPGQAADGQQMIPAPPVQPVPAPPQFPPPMPPLYPLQPSFGYPMMPPFGYPHPIAPCTRLNVHYNGPQKGLPAFSVQVSAHTQQYDRQYQHDTEWVFEVGSALAEAAAEWKQNILWLAIPHRFTAYTLHGTWEQPI
uniref:Uncharacterized protein n=1 Tax=Sphaerodactylus townsendi TaxID=933632 RepID=A0ACB8E691_9SAUR